MKYKEKIAHAKVVADQLEQKVNIDTIKSSLESEGLYQNDIQEVLVSARKFLGEKYQPKIREYLINGQDIHGDEAFELVDRDILDTLILQESQALALQEKRKITKLIKSGESAEDIYAQVDTRFLSEVAAADHISNLEQVKHDNSGTGRMLNVGGGIALIVLTGVLLFTMDRLFYVLPIIGIGLIVKGFMTQGMEYDS